MVTPLRQSCSSALWRLVLGRDMGCSSTHAGVGVPVRLCQMHRELHLTKRGSCGDRRNIIQFAHHHSRRAFVLLSHPGGFFFFLFFLKSCADLSRSGGGAGGGNSGVEPRRVQQQQKRKPTRVRPWYFLVFKGMVLFLKNASAQSPKNKDKFFFMKHNTTQSQHHNTTDGPQIATMGTNGWVGRMRPVLSYEKTMSTCAIPAGSSDSDTTNG